MFTHEDLHFVRQREIDLLAAYLPRGGTLLELGAGTGYQARELQNRGFQVSAVDLPASLYSEARVFPVLDYDGVNLPYPDATFDVVFSSNVLEHVRDHGPLFAEIRRVLKPGGYCVHAMPTVAWRFWSFVAALVDIVPMLISELSPRPGRGLLARLRGILRGLADRLSPKAHGERGIALTELWSFRARWWEKLFARHGYEMVKSEPVGLFYTAWFVFGRRWSIEGRTRASRTIGSACHVYQTRPRT